MAVTIAMMFMKNIKTNIGVLYIIVQFAGGFLGLFASHAMFIGNDFFQWIAISEVARSGGAYWAEFVGIFTLALVIYGSMHNKPAQPGLIIGFLVGGFLITTSSTMFANPQVTVARMFTWAIAGIRPLDGVVFVLVQIIAAVAAAGTGMYLFPQQERSG